MAKWKICLRTCYFFYGAIDQVHGRRFRFINHICWSQWNSLCKLWIKAEWNRIFYILLLVALLIGMDRYAYISFIILYRSHYKRIRAWVGGVRLYGCLLLPNNTYSYTYSSKFSLKLRKCTHFVLFLSDIIRNNLNQYVILNKINMLISFCYFFFFF